MKFTSQTIVIFIAATTISIYGHGVVGSSSESSLRHRSVLVVGGDESDYGEFPYYVSMGGCGGSLIAPRVVLTAAHCQPQNYNINEQVTVGPTKRNSLNNEGFKNAERILVTDAISHPKFGEGTGINYDYALMLLETEYIIESDITLKLNFDSDFPEEGSVLDVLGMGTTSSGASSVANMLRDVKVPAITNAECKNNYGSSSVTSKMLCAGYPEGKKDACQGDSGGPLVKINGNIHTQVGITSWGYGCALAGKAGVYSRVSEEILWMRKVICDDWKVGSDLCDGDTPTPPTPSAPPSPTESPVDAATGDCEDRPQYEWKNKDGKNCEWVGEGNSRKKVRRKCKKKEPDSGGKKVMHFCPETCATVGKGPCAR